MSNDNDIELRYTQHIKSLREVCEKYKAASQALRKGSEYASRHCDDHFSTSTENFVDVLRYFGEICCRIPRLHGLSTLKIMSSTSKLINGEVENEDILKYLRDLRWLDVADKIENTILKDLRALNSHLSDHYSQSPDWNFVISPEEMTLLRDIRSFIAKEFDPWAKQLILSLKSSLSSPDSFPGRLSYLMAIIEVGEIVPLLLSPQEYYSADTIRLLKEGRDFFSKLSLRSICDLSHTVTTETIQEANEELISLLETILPDKPVVGISGARQLENVIHKLKIKAKETSPDATAKAKAEKEAKMFLYNFFPCPDGYEDSRDYFKQYYSKIKEVKKDGRRRQTPRSAECTNMPPKERYHNEYVVDNTIYCPATREAKHIINHEIPTETHLKVLKSIESTQESHDSHMKVKEQQERARQQRDKFFMPLAKVLSGNSSDDAKKKLERLKAPPDKNRQTKNDNELRSSSKPDMEKSLDTMCDELLNERGPEMQLAMRYLQEILDVDTNDDGQLCVRSRPNEALPQQDHLFEHIKKVFSRSTHCNVVSASRYLISAISKNFCDWSVSKSRPNLRHLLRCFRNFHFHSHRFYKTPLIAVRHRDRQYNDELDLVDHVTICVWELLPILARTALSESVETLCSERDRHTRQ